MRMWIIALCLLLPGWGAGEAQAADEDPVLRIGIDGRVRTADPHEAVGAMDLHVAEACFEGLTYIDPKTLQPVPGVAESWTVSEDRLVWTFTLRKEARWSDGRAVTPKDFARSFRRSLHPALGSAWAGMLQRVCGARAYNEYGRAAQRIKRDLHDRSFVAHLRLLAAAHPKGVNRTTWRAWPWARRLPEVLAEAPEPLAREAWLGRRAFWSPEDLATLGRSLETAGTRLQAAWKEAHESFGRTLGVIPVDEHTLRIELTEPQPWLLRVLAMPCTAPVSRVAQLELPRSRRAGAKATPPWWSAPEVPVNGPYRVREFHAAGRRPLALEANPKYWNAAAIRQRRIEVVSIPDPQTGLAKFSQASIDWSQSWPFDMVKALRRADTFRTCEAQIAYYYLFQCEHPALRDPRVRRALAQCVDRDALLNAALHGFGRAAETLVPSGLPGYVGPAKGLTFDPDAARALLAAAGQAGGKGLPEIVILFNTHEQHRAVAEAVAAGWREHLGVRVSLRNERWAGYGAAKHDGDFMVARMGWIGDYPDPMSFLERFESTHPGNVGRWSHAGFDALLGKARTEKSATKRLEILAEAEQLMLLEGTPCAPFYWYQTGDLVQPWVRGFRTRAEGPDPEQPGAHNVQGLHPFRGLWVERRK